MNPDTQKQIDTKRLGLDILLVKHCNLRCRGCSRYSNLSRPGYYDIDALKHDLQIIRNSDLSFDRLTFTGGEPLLYPLNWLEEIFSFARSLFPVVGLSLFTNGKDLLRCNLWDVFKKYNVGITYTQYINSGIDYEAIRKKANEKGVLCKNLSYYSTTETSEEYKQHMWLSKLSDHFNSSLEEKLKKCNGNCPVLWNSKIYLCGTSAFVDSLNSAFGTKFTVTNKDYLELKDFTSEKYFEFISKLTPFCNYCLNKDETEVIEWSTKRSTKKDYVHD